MNKKRKFSNIVCMILILSMVFTSVNVPVVAADSNVQDNKQEEHIYQNPVADEDGNVTWDTIWFGNYWQNDTNGDGIADRNDSPEPIKWRILQVDEEGNALLLADKILDCQLYNAVDNEEYDPEKPEMLISKYKWDTWENITVRSWLNGYGSESNAAGIDYSEDNFLNNAFSEEEIACFPEERNFVINKEQYAEDKVFLFDTNEFIEEYGMPIYGMDYEYNMGTRAAKTTPYAKQMGAISIYERDIDSGYPDHLAYWIDYKDNGSWYYILWEDGLPSGDIADDGVIYFSYQDYNEHQGVRPAIEINLNTDLVQYAGMVCSDGTQEEVIPSTGGEAKIEFAPASMTLKVGDTAPVTAKIILEDGTEGDSDSIWWVSEDEEVATVDNDGIITAVGEGTVLLWAQSGTLIYGYSVTVLPAQGGPTDSIELKNPDIDEDNNVTWDCVYFGNYWQNDTNGDGTADRNDKPEPIKWRVLSVDEKNDTALLLADQALDAKFYNTEAANVVWCDCTLRSWLNSYDESANAQGIDYSTDGFLKDAFSLYEQSAIVTTSLDNDNYDEWWSYVNDGNNEGIATEDKVFLISLEDLANSDYGFLKGQEYGEGEDNYYGYPTNMAKPTNYAIDNKCYVSKFKGLEGNCYWWLRLRGGYAIENESENVDPGAPCVGATGDPYIFAGQMLQDGVEYGTSGLFTVRPAITLDLSATDYYTYAGTVCSDGTTKLPEKPDPDEPEQISANGVAISYDGKTVSEDDVVMLSLRNDITLVASVSPNNATNKNVIWNSTNKKVATISANGTEAVLTGVGVGNTIISVKTEDGEYTALCNVSVNVVSVDSVAIAYKGKTVSYNEITLNKGNSLTLDAVINPSNASDKTVSWNSSDTEIVTISANGKVVAVSAGNAVITVSSNDGGKTASCNITVVSGNGTDSASENKTPSGESGNNPGGSEGKEEKVYKVEVTYGENGLVSANRTGSVSYADVSEVTSKGNDSSFEVKVKEDKDVSFLVTPDAEYGIDVIKVVQGESKIEEVSGNAVKSENGNIVISAKDSAGNVTVTISSMSDDATLEVSFKQTTYSASINVIGDETIALKVVDGKLFDTAGKEIKELPQPVKAGEIFEGWVTEDGTEVTMDNIVEVITTGKKIQARWAFVNVVVKQKVDIRALMNISANDIYNIKKYQVMYQGVKNSKYASITSKGVLTAKKVEADGKPITVQVVALDRSGRTLGGCNVTIVGTKADASKILVANASMNQIGATYDMNELLASSLPKNSYDKITWSVPKGCKVASINEKGILTALDKSGKVKVTAEIVNTSETATAAKNRTAKVTFTIAVKLPKQAIKKATVQVSKEKLLKLTNLSGQKVEWSVDKKASVKLVENGTDSKGVNSVVITGVKADTVKVTAYVNGDKQHPYVYEVTVK